YGYDAATQQTALTGSLAATLLPSAMGSATYNAANELTRVGSGPVQTYDNEGRLLSDGVHSYSWTARGELAGIDASSTFAYDPFGRRTQMTVSGASTSFRYDGDNLLSAAGASSTTSYLLGRDVDETFMAKTGAATVSLLTDALGSTLGLVSAGNSLATRYTYD